MKKYNLSWPAGVPALCIFIGLAAAILTPRRDSIAAVTPSGSLPFNPTNVNLYGPVLNGVMKQSTSAHYPDSDGTNYIVDFSLNSEREIFCTNNVNFSGSTNSLASKTVYVTYSIYANGTNRILSWPTNWVVLGNAFTNGFVVTNSAVISFRSQSGTRTNVWVSGSFGGPYQ